ncbi:MAG: hypothetical protein AAFX57_10815 [Bacteroidota bacterium]
MRRDEHLSFCKICKLQSFDKQRGITCSLTNSIASFEDACPSYKLDSQKLKPIIDPIRNEYENQNLKNKSISRKITGPHSKYHFIPQIAGEQNELEVDTVIYKHSGMKDLSFAIVATVVSIFALKDFNLNSFIEYFISQTILMQLLTIMLIISFIYGLTRWISVFNKKPELAFTKQGIISKKHGLTKLNTIAFPVIRDHRNKEQTVELILHLMSSSKENPLTIDLTYLNAKHHEIADQLGIHLNHYRTNFKDHNIR